MKKTKKDYAAPEFNVSVINAEDIIMASGTLKDFGAATLSKGKILDID